MASFVILTPLRMARQFYSVMNYPYNATLGILLLTHVFFIFYAGARFFQQVKQMSPEQKYVYYAKKESDILRIISMLNIDTGYHCFNHGSLRSPHVTHPPNFVHIFYRDSAPISHFSRSFKVFGIHYCFLCCSCCHSQQTWRKRISNRNDNGYALRVIQRRPRIFRA